MFASSRYNSPTDVVMDTSDSSQATPPMLGKDADSTMGSQECLVNAAKEVIENEWKKSPQLIQELYSLLSNEERDIRTFHLWLYMLDHNLTPNIRDLTIDYRTIDCMHDGFSLVRLSFRANADSTLNRKTQIQVLAFSSDPKEEDDSNTKIPWDLFLKELECQHMIMYRNGEIDGDYDCFVAYKQYSRLYTLHGQEQPNIRQCWVRFTAEKMMEYNIQPLHQDPHDLGPLLEFKVHYSLISHLLRAFAWNINIPYVCVSPKPKHRH